MNEIRYFFILRGKLTELSLGASGADVVLKGLQRASQALLLQARLRKPVLGREKASFPSLYGPAHTPCFLPPG